jgi:F-type H+-transporting ATPase subunit a
MNFLTLDTSNVLNWDSTTFSGELIMSFIAMGIVVILAIVVWFVFRHRDPTKPDKGFVLLVETAVEKLEASVVDIMGKKWLPFAGYILGLALYIITCFFLGITGLPNALTNLTCPLSIGLCTFILIHATAVKANKWKYFHRYIDPFPLFLPINLLSMWAPLISISLRLFGNAVSGYALMTIVYFYLQMASNALFGGLSTAAIWAGTGAGNFGASSIWIAPLITSWLHIYFDVFSSVIQALIFCMLTMIWVSQEDPEEDAEESGSLKSDNPTLATANS